MHDDTWLYVAVIATDDEILIDTEPEGSHNANTWHDDSIEIFIDQNLNHGADTTNNSYGGELIEAQYVLTAGNATRDANSSIPPIIGSTDDDDWWCWATVVDNGWIGEMRFKKELLVGEGPVGFTMAMNDDDTDSTFPERQPDHQIRWQGAPHVQSSWGVLFLGDAAVGIPNWMLH
jgi:hypothetical protein